MERERRSRKRAKRQSRQEILGRYVRIEASKQSVGLRADCPRGQPPALATSASVELRGRLDEPVANVTEARITVFPDPAAQYRVDDARRRHPVSTGDIEIRVVVRGSRDQRGIDPRMNVTG